jgi:hypothetical protein
LNQTNGHLQEGKTPEGEYIKNYNWITEVSETIHRYKMTVTKPVFQNI